MLKENKKLLIVTSIIILLPMIVGLVLWSRLPDQLATHWGTQNEPNGWSSREFTVFAMPLILLALHWLCIFATTSDPKKQNISSKLFGLVLWIVPLVTIVVFGVIYTAALGMTANVGLVCILLMGVLFIVIGNYLPKCRQNHTVGIRLAWTLNDEANWNATHRFAGWVWMIGGVIILLTAPLVNPWIFFPIVVLMALLPVVFSYIYFRKHK